MLTCACDGPRIPKDKYLCWRVGYCLCLMQQSQKQSQKLCTKMSKLIDGSKRNCTLKEVELIEDKKIIGVYKDRIIKVPLSDQLTDHTYDNSSRKRTTLTDMLLK